MTNPPTLREAFRFWLKLGFISFGGPAGQVAIMHNFLVEQKKWISESRFMHALNYCMLLPGPEAQQLATYTGWLLHGVRGGLMAGILFILPSVFILLLLSILYVTWGNIPWVSAMFDGLKPAVIAVVAMALVKIGKKSLHGILHYAVALAAFAAIFFLKVPFPLIIVAALVMGIVLYLFAPALLAAAAAKEKAATLQEEGYFINRYTPMRGNNKLTRNLVIIGVVFVLAWLVPFLFLAAGEQGTFWQTLIVFFTKAAFVTFGGAYAVLPYVAQVSVEKLHWLSAAHMLDGLALGETTPGPLIMVLAFVGFMGGWNQYGQSLAGGATGLLATVFYTFLPCFLFIFAGAPLIERTRENKGIRYLLHIVTAAVVGVVLNLSIYLLLQVVFRGPVAALQVYYPHLIWVVVSFLAMYRFKAGIITWLAVSALYGIAVHFSGLV